MRGMLAAVLGVAIGAAAFGASHALATSSGPDVRVGGSSDRSAALQQQVADLGAQVKVLTAQVKALQKRFNQQSSYDNAIYNSETCILAVTADSLQGTWRVVDAIASPTLHQTFFPTINPVDDRGACGGFKFSRTLVQNPPTLQGFAQMIAWLQG